MSCSNHYAISCRYNAVYFHFITIDYNQYRIYANHETIPSQYVIIYNYNKIHLKDKAFLTKYEAIHYNLNTIQFDYKSIHSYSEMICSNYDASHSPVTIKFTAITVQSNSLQFQNSPDAIHSISNTIHRNPPVDCGVHQGPE